MTAMTHLSAPELDSYDHVVSALQKYHGSTISVPYLSHLLGVKATTLNARFRRERISVSSVGRTNYIPCELALKLADVHKYALLGWPTLQQASALVAAKVGTIKARCEKGHLEAHLDLTKKLRINPARLEGFHLLARKDRPKNPPKQPRKPPVPTPKPKAKNRHPYSERLLPARPPFRLPPAPEPDIEFITSRDYGLLEFAEPAAPRVQLPAVPNRKQKTSGPLTYNPDQPFSVSECCVGKSVRYGPYKGTILKVLDDGFSPIIQVKFPNHEHPLMREVLLIVGKRVTTTA